MAEIEPDRWRHLRDLLDRAIDLEGDARLAYLDGLCVHDEALKRDVETLLARHEQLKLSTPTNAMALVTRWFVADGARKRGK